MPPTRRLREVQFHSASHFHPLREVKIDGVAPPDTLEGGLHRGGIIHIQSVATRGPRDLRGTR